MTKKPEAAGSIKPVTSPERNTFQKENYLKRCIKEGVLPSEAYLQMWDDAAVREEEWANSDDHSNDLEWDLRTSDWVVAKAKASESYAQNIYAALCNNQFQKIDVMPILKDQRWSCTWRYAGGIVADLCGAGDYIDWYCSGMGPKDGTGFVSESTITDEVRADLKKLGWMAIDEDTDRY